MTRGKEVSFVRLLEPAQLRLYKEEVMRGIDKVPGKNQSNEAVFALMEKAITRADRVVWLGFREAKFVGVASATVETTEFGDRRVALWFLHSCVELEEAGAFIREHLVPWAKRAKAKTIYLRRWSEAADPGFRRIVRIFGFEKKWVEYEKPLKETEQ